MLQFKVLILELLAVDRFSARTLHHKGAVVSIWLME